MTDERPDELVEHGDAPAPAERRTDSEENHPVTQHEDEVGSESTQGTQGTEGTQGTDEAKVLGNDTPDAAVFGEQPDAVQPEGAQPDAEPEPVTLSGTPSERLAQLGVTLPDVPAPVADYVPAVRTGNLVHTSGQLPFVDGRLNTTGVVGDQPVDVTPEEAAVLARQCALNAIAAVASLVDVDDVVRVVKVTGFVASAPGFVQQPVVLNGASALLGQVFGDAGRHARSAVGVAALPLGAPVEVEIVVEVR